ncbi:hypothetical protein HY990_00685 [Candidatus Micrarchaeota archaeon]|nr:hypothetical protein [Candidatus Micrarchaeota archaeon]
MKVCVICKKELQPGIKAYPIVEDVIIRAIRSIKRSLSVVKNNDLYVCEADLPMHGKIRKSFERNMVIAAFASAVIFVLFIGTAILSARFDLLGIFSALFLCFCIFIIPLFWYVPSISEKTVEVTNNGGA